MLIRTTLRIEEKLKKDAERKALEDDITLQEIFNKALEDYLKKAAKKEAKKMIFKSYHLGEPLDNLTRDDIYD
jgi:GR25 family glycosyltransferase involved in LPS biosynthesis